jgi:hypothetical protein
MTRHCPNYNATFRHTRHCHVRKLGIVPATTQHLGIQTLSLARLDTAPVTRRHLGIHLLHMDIIKASKRHLSILDIVNCHNWTLPQLQQDTWHTRHCHLLQLDTVPAIRRHLGTPDVVIATTGHCHSYNKTLGIPDIVTCHDWTLH